MNKLAILGLVVIVFAAFSSAHVKHIEPLVDMSRYDRTRYRVRSMKNLGQLIPDRSSFGDDKKLSPTIIC